MNANHWVGSDTRDYGGSHPPSGVAFKQACEALRLAIEKASCPGLSHVDDAFHEAEAVWFSRHVAHEARRLGLLKEPLDVSVLIRLDVDAGEPVTP